MIPGRWDPCVSHRGAEIDGFIDAYFATADRRTLLVCGAGFDPRSTAVATRLAHTQGQIRGLFLQEERPNPAQALVDRAGANGGVLRGAIANHRAAQVNIFGPDGAVVGGRNAVAMISAEDLDWITDIVVDISALSVGTAFPIVRYLVERSARTPPPFNLHLFVTHNPGLDGAIASISSDAPGFVHGFRGGSTLDGSANAAKLWLPQLASGRTSALGRLHSFVDPHDTCPILPFPAIDPRAGDHLAEEFLTEFESGWSVDTRNIVYADESDPLDLYRTILRLDDLRKPVFAEMGGSLLILSPLGSKVMALGALMAALERDLPVAYLEAIGYEFDASTVHEEPVDVIHIWLEGEVYPQPRPALHNEGVAA
jgi:hypothetical protein